jgi:hypothetical protein
VKINGLMALRIMGLGLNRYAVLVLQPERSLSIPM